MRLEKDSSQAPGEGQRDPDAEAWFYGKGGDPIGPHTPSEMRELFASGDLEARNLVWTEGMENWVEARTLDFLRPGPPSSQPPAHEETDTPCPIETIDEPDLDPPRRDFSPREFLNAEVQKQGPQVRPWVRMFARVIDMDLGCTFIFMTSGNPDLVENMFMPQYLMYFLFGWVLMETCLMSTWGTTPGKWLLKIQVTDATGGKLELAQAFLRSLQVWIRGMGMGIPILSLITLMMSHGRLVQDGSTRWDQLGNFKVVHGRFTFRRLALAGLAFTLFFQVVVAPMVPAA